MMKRYPIIISEVPQNISKGNIYAIPQDLSRRSYCGKREPSDGLIIDL
jgi:methionyl-tRNA formyltransferase